MKTSRAGFSRWRGLSSLENKNRQTGPRLSDNCLERMGRVLFPVFTHAEMTIDDQGKDKLVKDVNAGLYRKD